MQSRFRGALPAGSAALADELPRILQELGESASDSSGGECVPPVDIYETDEAIEIVMDVPGVAATALRVLARGDAILLAGEKAAARVRRDASFHLVERGFGRFARSVHLMRSCDISRARAWVSHGELHVSLPKIPEQRGRAIEIPVSTA